MGEIASKKYYGRQNTVDVVEIKVLMSLQKQKGSC
jgi:hypothetical protein